MTVKSFTSGRSTDADYWQRLADWCLTKALEANTLSSTNFWATAGDRAEAKLALIRAQAPKRSH